jgi:CDGSH iron-sulfur domain-containing protein 3
MSELPKIAQKKSYKTEVVAGKDYYWCACGLSNSQPFCDGSHKGTGFAPTKYTAQNDGIVGFCGCKQSKLGALCDGAHKLL